MNGDLSESQITEVMTLAKRHHLLHLATKYLLSLPLSDELRMACKSAKAYAQYSCLQQTSVLSLIKEAFEKNAVDFIPLKGLVLRELYPSPWMRLCADIDILVHEIDLNRASEILTNELKMEQVFRGSHDFKFNYLDVVTVELHYRLMEDDVARDASGLLNDCWQFTLGDSHCKQLTKEMFFLFHIAHMAKHFELGGCSIRFFMDLWLLDHRVSFDEDIRTELIKKANLCVFTEKVRLISEKWFSGAETEGIELIEDYIIKRGSYGNIDNNVSVGKYKSGGSMGYLRSRLFVSYDYLKLLYPVLEHRRYLVPVYEVVRWFRFVLPESRAHTAKELHSLSKDTNDGTLEILKEVGLL